MLLRKFTPADKAAFLEMCADFYSCGAAAAPIPPAQMEATFNEIAGGSPFAFGYLFDLDGTTAGYALGFPFYSNEAGGLCLMLEEIYVRPDFRSLKLGTEYLATIADTVGRDLGHAITGLKLEICPGNARARKLYDAAGFIPLEYASMVKPVQSLPLPQSKVQ